MDLIVETDIGRDADDFFALCWLAGAGIRLKAILISPGDRDQVSVAKFLLREVGCEAPVGVSRFGRDKSSASAFHRDLLIQHGWPLEMNPDGTGPEIMRDVLNLNPATPCFACGPMDSFGAYLKMDGVSGISSLTVQGGFAPYDIYAPADRVAKFEGHKEVPSFNLNSNMSAAHKVLNAKGTVRRLVGKNVCHSILYSRAIHDLVMAVVPTNPAMALFRKAMSQYMERHVDKKFHDPVAAVCHVHPEVGTWIRGKPYKTNGKWGTRLDPQGDHILVDLDREAFWKHVAVGA